MKRLLITAILSITVLTVKGQDTKINPLDEENSPLLVVQYEGEKIEFHDHNSSDLLKAIPTDGIRSIEVIKGNSAKLLYGESGKNGVVMLTLVPNDSNDLFFKKLQAGKLPAPSIKTETDISVDEKTSFSLDPSTYLENGQLKIRGESLLTKDGGNPLIILGLGDEQLELDKFSLIEDLDMKYFKSIDVIKPKTDKGDAGTVIIQLVKNTKTKKLFKKLKRSQKK